VGVHAIRFVHSARAPRTFCDGTVSRLGRVAASAVEQCGRARLPQVTGTHTWEEIETLVEGITDRWMLDTAAAAPASAEPAPSPGGPVALLVGPEGGWAEEEREELRTHGWRPLGLGPRVLRTETAAVVSVARFALTP
jgi:16S rRNA (uracil1498-N3)-methyltransferase